MQKCKKVNSYFFILGLTYLIGLSSFSACNDRSGKIVKEAKALNMQSYIDSCAHLYLMAINEVKQGHNKEEVKSKYANSIIFLHSQFSKSFDSITLLYTNGKLTQVEYDNIIQSIVLDSVSKKSSELSELGINYDLD